MPTKDERVTSVRMAQLRTFAPDVFAPGTLLYVGASVHRIQFLPELMAAGRRVTILEVWPANCDHFKAQGYDVILGDVCALPDLPHFDVAFWWHGPEHIAKADLPTALAGLERHARLVVASAPWGISKQRDIYGNPWNRHVSTLYPRDFARLGYRVNTVGRENTGSASNILAVKP